MIWDHNRVAERTHIDSGGMISMNFLGGQTCSFRCDLSFSSIFVPISIYCLRKFMIVSYFLLSVVCKHFSFCFDANKEKSVLFTKGKGHTCIDTATKEHIDGRWTLCLHIDATCWQFYPLKCLYLYISVFFSSVVATVSWFEVQKWPPNSKIKQLRSKKNLGYQNANIG